MADRLVDHGSPNKVSMKKKNVVVRDWSGIYSSGERRVILVRKGVHFA